MLEIFIYNPLLKSSSLNLKVKAAAKSNLINGFIAISDKQYLKISIKTIPTKGKANEAIIDFLAQEWNISKHNLKIISGHTNCFKVLLIKNIDPSYLNSILAHYIK